MFTRQSAEVHKKIVGRYTQDRHQKYIRMQVGIYTHKTGIRSTLGCR